MGHHKRYKMTFRDYKHIELLEEITIPVKRVENGKIINVKKILIGDTDQRKVFTN